MQDKKIWTMGNILFLIVGILLAVGWLVFCLLDVYNVLPGCKWIGYLFASVLWLEIGLRNIKHSNVSGIISLAAAAVYAVTCILALLP